MGGCTRSHHRAQLVKAIPWEAQRVLAQLRDWRRSARKFKRVAVVTIAHGSHGIEVPAYQVRDVRGRQHIISAAEISSERQMIARLSREARRRLRACDWEWFLWLYEYGRLVASDIWDDFDVLHTPAIEAHIRTVTHQRAMTAKAAEKRRKIGEATRARVQTRGKRGAAVSDRHFRRLKKPPK